MADTTISSLSGSLDAELEKARETLKGVDDSIKRVFGKDATELLPFQNWSGRRDQQQPQEEEEDDDDQFEEGELQPDELGPDLRDSHLMRRRSRDGGFFEDGPLEKRRRFDMSRLAPPPGGGGGLLGGRIQPRLKHNNGGFGNGHPHHHEVSSGPLRLQSRVVNSAKEKSREEVLAEQRKDRSGRDRSKRMFGALLGTLQAFKRDETKLKEKEERRAQIEAKLEEAERDERDQVKREKQQLIRDRKYKLTEIKRLEIKKRRIDELDQWETKTRYLSNFIRTESKPHIFYIPKVLNPLMECKREQSKQFVTEMIATKRKMVLEDIDNYEQRSKSYWETKLDGVDTRKLQLELEVDPQDEDIDMELKVLMNKIEKEKVPPEVEPEPEVPEQRETVEEPESLEPE